MRHRVVKKKLAANKDHARSLLSNLSTQLIMKEKIETTLAKAKMLRPHIEKLVTYAGKATNQNDKAKKFNVIKNLNAKIAVKSATRKLIEDIAARYSDTPGGYTRIVRTGFRQGDNASMARIEFTKKPVKKSGKSAAKKDE